MTRMKTILAITILLVATIIFVQLSFDNVYKLQIIPRISEGSFLAVVSNASFPVSAVPFATSSASRAFTKHTTQSMSTTPKKVLQPPPSTVVRFQRKPMVIENSYSGNLKTPDIVELVSRHRNLSSMYSRFRPNPFRLLQKLVERYPVVDSNKVERIILVTYFRSGSTFIGDILQANPRSFYHFEPLHMYTSDSRVNSSVFTEAKTLLSGLFRCDFRPLTKYMEWVRKAKNQFLFKHNRFLWSFCGMKPSICFSPDFVSSVCKRSPLQVIKVTRLHMHQVRSFIQENKDLNIKIVHLVRDPRGIMSSRRRLEWCNTSQCVDYKNLCREIANDTDVFEVLKRASPSSLHQVRYEDISVNAAKSTASLFRELGLPYTSSLSVFLRTHTRAKEKDALDPYSTKRNSATVPFEWRYKLDFADILKMQTSCSDVLHRLGYKLLTNQSDIESNVMPIVEKTSLT